MVKLQPTLFNRAYIILFKIETREIVKQHSSCKVTNHVFKTDFILSIFTITKQVFKNWIQILSIFEGLKSTTLPKLLKQTKIPVMPLTALMTVPREIYLPVLNSWTRQPTRHDISPSSHDFSRLYFKYGFDRRNLNLPMHFKKKTF